MATSQLIRIGTRQSSLALAQVEEVKSSLLDINSNLTFETYPIITSGDKIQDRSLFDIGGKALFLKEIEDELVNNKIDIAIHSAKDVPPIIKDHTKLISFTKRLDPRDCFISNKYKSLHDLPSQSIIGTTSPRRKAILLKIRPDINIKILRGNITTRLSKLEKGDVDATILSKCGLERMNLSNKITTTLPTDSFLPAGGQGSLAIQIRNNNDNIAKISRSINCFKSEICIRAERSFLHELGASCFTPVAVYGEINNSNQLFLKTILLDIDGSELFELSNICQATKDEAILLGKEMALKTKKDAHLLVKKICNNF